jgi:hypothetical protein
VRDGWQGTRLVSVKAESANADCSGVAPVLRPPRGVRKCARASCHARRMLASVAGNGTAVTSGRFPLSFRLCGVKFGIPHGGMTTGNAGELRDLFLSTCGRLAIAESLSKDRRSIDVRNARYPGSKFLLVQVGVAHINHRSGDNRDENLAALCRGCHLNHDQIQHRDTRRVRKDFSRPLLAGLTPQTQTPPLGEE